MDSLTDWTNETPERRRAYEQERLIVDVSEAIQELMQRKNFTKADLARALGTSKSNVTQLFAGNRNMTLRTIAVFASALGVRVSVSFVPVDQDAQALKGKCICPSGVSFSICPVCNPRSAPESPEASPALRAYDEAMQAFGMPREPLEVYTSNSFNRVGLARTYSSVMTPVVHNDGHPDIEGKLVLHALVAAFNAMLEIRKPAP